MAGDDRPIARVIEAFGRAVPDAFFVQVGAHDGTALDPLRRQIIERRWSGIMVEPVPAVFERLRASYGDDPRLVLENMAVADHDGSRDFHYLREAAAGDDVWAWYDALGSFRRDVVLSHRHLVPDIDDRIETMAVPCTTFASLCQRHGVATIDVVQIDTEGYDLEVLRLVDLDRWRPALVMFEHLHLDDDERDEACRLLDGNGYERIADGMDTLGVRRDVLDELPALAVAWREAAGVPASAADAAAVQERVRRLAVTARRASRRAVDVALGRAGLEIVRRTGGAEQPLALTDRSQPLPPGAEDALRPDNPLLVELRATYADLDWPVTRHSRWQPEQVTPWLDLARFRGDNAYVWHYREGDRVTQLKFFLYLEHVAATDHAGLLGRLEEDGAFGCWTWSFPGRPRCSRDLLDSVNELSFLDRATGLLDTAGARVLDIGAGYGRLAHRGACAAPGLADWCCVDAVAESTFLSTWYLEHRGVVPPTRVVPLPEVPSLPAGAFDLACNVHSWSECTRSAIRWWVAQLARLEVPRLFVVPNEPEGFLSLEIDGRRLDYRGIIEAAGYRLTVDEPAIADPAVRDLLDLHDRYCLFERA